MRKTIPVMIQRLPSAIPVAFPSGTEKKWGQRETKKRKRTRLLCTTTCRLITLAIGCREHRINLLHCHKYIQTHTYSNTKSPRRTGSSADTHIEPDNDNLKTLSLATSLGSVVNPDPDSDRVKSASFCQIRTGIGMPRNKCLMGRGLFGDRWNKENTNVNEEKYMGK